MFHGMKKISLALCLVILAVPRAGSAKERPFPTPQRRNESVQQSIGRIHRDQARGKKMLAAIERRQAELVGKKVFDRYKAGSCPQFKCVKGKSAQSAAQLISRSAAVTQTMKDLADEKSTLVAMVKTMNAPLKNNNTNQPGVSTAVVAGSASSPTANPPNQFLPPPTPDPAAAAVVPAAPGQATSPGQAPAAPAPPSGQAN